MLSTADSPLLLPGKTLIVAEEGLDNDIVHTVARSPSDAALITKNVRRIIKNVRIKFGLDWSLVMLPTSISLSI